MYSKGGKKEEPVPSVRLDVVKCKTHQTSYDVQA